MQNFFVAHLEQNIPNTKLQGENYRHYFQDREGLGLAREFCNIFINKDNKRCMHFVLSSFTLKESKTFCPSVHLCPFI